MCLKLEMHTWIQIPVASIPTLKSEKLFLTSLLLLVKSLWWEPDFGVMLLSCKL